MGEQTRRIVICGWSALALVVEKSLAKLPQIEVVRLDPRLPRAEDRVAALADTEAVLRAPLAGLEELDLRPLESRLEIPGSVQLERRWPAEGQSGVLGRPGNPGVFGALAPWR